jgi:hypothetical protein
MFTLGHSRCALVAGFAVSALAGTASAELTVGLTSTNQLVSFNTFAPGSILLTSPAISGLAQGDSIVDIDYYPVNGLLHGMSSSGTLYRIDRMTGVATIDAVPQTSMGVVQDIDFNPAADRLRVFSAGDANFRITPSVGTAGPNGANTGLVTGDGTLMFAGGTPNPNLVAAAYTNNFDGTAATTLYSIDADLDALIIHSGAPQFSMLAQVGALGVDVGQNVGFDVSISGLAYVSNGSSLYTIDLSTGALTSLGSIGGSLGITTIAVVPAPAGAGVLAIAGLACLRRRR